MHPPSPQTMPHPHPHPHRRIPKRRAPTLGSPIGGSSSPPALNAFAPSFFPRPDAAEPIGVGDGIVRDDDDDVPLAMLIYIHTDIMPLLLER